MHKCPTNSELAKISDKVIGTAENDQNLVPIKAICDAINPEYTNKIIQILSERYSPASSPADADEMLTSVDLIEEISDFAETTKEIVFDAMNNAGFKIHYTGSGFVWLLKSV